MLGRRSWHKAYIKFCKNRSTGLKVEIDDTASRRSHMPTLFP
jgi:hypothetical protein